MSVRVVPATRELFKPVLERFLRQLNPRVAEDTWMRLFQSHWGVESRSVGTVLLDGDRPVGFAAFVYAKLPREAAPPATLCNISTWVTEPEHSSRALSLVMPVLADREVCITNLTPIPSVHAIFSKLGFQTLEEHLVYLRPAPLARSAWPSAREERTLDRVLPNLPEWERAVAASHGDWVHHLWVEGPSGRHAYVMYQVVRRRRVRTARILWVTPGAMPDASLVLRRALFRACGALLVELDARHAGGTPPASFVQPLVVPRMYRSPTLSPTEVPNAFSELVVLGV